MTACNGAIWIFLNGCTHCFGVGLPRVFDLSAPVRSEETGRTHPLAGLLSELRQHGQVVELPLSPLDAEETATLAAQVARHPLDAMDSGALFRTTKGNPLFVVESVRAGLRDAGEGAGDGSISAPPRVHAVITARLAQLSAPAYELAGLASAAGRAFSLDLLAKSTDWDEDSLSAALDELWQRRIIEGQGEAHGAAQYDFTHDRLREVAYAELSPVRRRFLHRRIARALEELHPVDSEGISSQLAAHYEAAGLQEEAIRHYQKAAEVARHRFADAEAAGQLRRALALCRNLPETARRDRQELELLVTLGPVLVTTQGYSIPEVGETYERGLLLAGRLGGNEHIFAVLSGAWGFHVVSGQIEEARALGLQCLDLAGQDGGAELSLLGEFILGSSTYHLGQFAASESHFERALTVYSGHSHPALALFAGPDVGVFCRSYRSHVSWQLGKADMAIRNSEEALAAAGQVKNPFSMAIALNYAAMLAVYDGDSQTALARAEEAAAVCRKHGFTYYLSMADILAGWATAGQGSPEAGVMRLRQGLEGLKKMGAEVRLPFYLGLLAECCALAGQLGEALANISNAFAYQSKNGETWAAAELYRIQGDLLLQNGNPLQARASYQRSLDAAQASGARSFELRAAGRLRDMESRNARAASPRTL